MSHRKGEKKLKIIFNDSSELQIQNAAAVDGKLEIKTISATLPELRSKFSDTFATKKMEIMEREQVIATYDDYNILYRIEEYAGGITGVVMYQEQKTPEAQVEIVNAAVAVAQIQAQSLTDEQALNVQAIYPAWNAGNVTYTIGYKILYNNVLYKCLQQHNSQSDWTPDAAPSLWAKVLISDSEVIPEWEQPDSTNPYGKGDRVTHNGKTWESLVDSNVWEPGATGTESLWKEVA